MPASARAAHDRVVGNEAVGIVGIACVGPAVGIAAHVAERRPHLPEGSIILRRQLASTTAWLRVGAVGAGHGARMAR